MRIFAHLFSFSLQKITPLLLLIQPAYTINHLASPAPYYCIKDVSNHNAYSNAKRNLRGTYNILDKHRLVMLEKTNHSIIQSLSRH